MDLVSLTGRGTARKGDGLRPELSLELKFSAGTFEIQHFLDEICYPGAILTNLIKTLIFFSLKEKKY